MTAAAREAPGFIALEGGDSRVEIVPALGGRIRSLELFGQEWLVQGGDDTLPKVGRPPLAGAGWDECAPSLGGGAMPEWVKGVGGRTLVAGGEARLQQPETTLRTGADGHQVVNVWRGERLPWVLTRTLFVRKDGAIETRYEALTTGRDRLPFLWSALMLFPLGPKTQVKLPDAGRLRVASLSGAKLSGDIKTTSAKWPHLPMDGKSRDLVNPWSIPKTAQMYAWLDMGNGRSMIQLLQDDARLTITTDGAGVPHCGVFLDRAGTSRGSRGKVEPVLALVPSLGAPDTYADALGQWQSVTWLAPGEPRRWTMTIRGGT